MPVLHGRALQSGLPLSFSLLRVVLIAHTLALIAQSALAGEFLSGTDSIVKMHEWTAWLILALCLLQIALAAISMRSGVTSLWLLIGSVFILLAEALQTGTGYGRFLRVHIPLGVIAAGAVSLQLFSVFRTSNGGLRK